MIRPVTAQERQGDLSDLNLKTKAELMDLLARQEKLLANRKFLSRLQDKGARVEQLAEKLRMMIKNLEDIDSTGQLFEKMDLGQDSSVINDTTEKTNKTLNQSKSLNPVIEKRSVKPNEISQSRYSSSSLAKLKEDTCRKFKPNKDLKSSDIPDDLPRPSIDPPVVKGQNSLDRSSVEQLGAEMSSAVIPPLRNQEAQVVEFEESATLLQEQKKNAEALVAKQAAERLTERLNIQMGDYVLPVTQESSYRDGAADSDDEESSEDDEDEESGDDAGDGD